MKKELMVFILKILDKTYKFLSKMRCSFCCCNSNCVVDKSVHVDCPDETKFKIDPSIRQTKSESDLNKN